MGDISSSGGGPLFTSGTGQRDVDISFVFGVVIGSLLTLLGVVVVIAVGT